MDLVEAFSKIPNVQDSAHLILLGDGEYRKNIEHFIDSNLLHAEITLTGFINQSEIVNYYALSDVFVMSSQQGETWGLSTNEAMNFGLPVILSDLTGCASDLVHEGENGYVYPTGDKSALRNILQDMVAMTPGERTQMGSHSKEIIEQYSYKEILEQLFSKLPNLK
jgi:glycosyltransferase involved in cell wall biosynthesis